MRIRQDHVSRVCLVEVVDAEELIEHGDHERTNRWIWREDDNELRGISGSDVLGTNLSLRRPAEEVQETARVVFEFGDPSTIGLDKDDSDVACNTPPPAALGGSIRLL